MRIDRGFTPRPGRARLVATPQQPETIRLTRFSRLLEGISFFGFVSKTYRRYAHFAGSHPPCATFFRVPVPTVWKLCNIGFGRADFGRLNCGLEKIMKKLSIMAAAAALAAATAAPVAADTKDPFVSTQGGLGAASGMAVVGVVSVALIIAASDGS